jgi:Ca2+:H+ antiporter
MRAIFSAAKASSLDVSKEVLKISRGTAIILLVAYFAYEIFDITSHLDIHKEIFRKRHESEQRKRKISAMLTFTEAVIALIIAITCVTFMALFLVDGIHFIVERRHIKDGFLGLILVPVVEKAAEHLGAVGEAWDGQLDAAISHVLGSSIQTALLITPIIVLVGWIIDVPLNLRFDIFDAAVLILAIVVISSFLRNSKTDWLEGILCILLYLIIAINTYY